MAECQIMPAMVDSIRRAYQIPEVAYAVIGVDSIIESGVIGYHRFDKQDKEDSANILDYFHLGSNTKAITSFVAACLVEKGKIQWSTRFFDLFPAWRKESNSDYFQITLQDLLTHRARIQPYTSGLEFQELPPFKGSKSGKRQLFCKYLLKEKVAQLNGQSYLYSNAGYTIAALMLERVSGRTWEQLVDSILIKKLHLQYRFGWPNKSNNNQPWGHLLQNDSLKALPGNYNYNLELIEPAGDISMPILDYVHFIQLNLKGMAGVSSVLNSNTWHLLHFGLKEYAFGWANVTKNNEQIADHAGSAGTFFAYTILYKQKKLAFVILTNSATGKNQEGVFKILEKMQKKYITQ